MLVVNLNYNKENYVSLPKENYFVLKSEKNFLVIPDSCPHRKGSLRLGRWRGNSIECPLHGTCISIYYLLSKSIAMVKSGQNIKLVFDVPEGTPFTKFWKETKL